MVQPTFLQVFASQFKSSLAHVCIQELGTESQNCNGAMALAVTTVSAFSVVACKQLMIVQLKCTLSLISNGDIDITLVTKDRETTGSKHKCKSSKTKVWKIKQPNGTPQPFSDTLWGGVTHDYMTSWCQVPQDAMAKIIDEVDLVVKSQKTKAATVVNSEQ